MGPMSSVPKIELNDGHTIPHLGFGVFQIPTEETAEAVRRALDVGYRHIDTAQMYGNESDYVSTWKTLEEFKAEGRARSIGVSNFEVDHLERLAAECDVVPAVNQIELHPYFQNEEVRRYGEERGIATQAWSPIAQGEVLDDPAIGEIAERLGRTPAQVVLRWHIQRGSIVFPKSTTAARIEENFALFDFELDADDVGRIEALDRGESGRNGPHPNHFDMVPS